MKKKILDPKKLMKEQKTARNKIAKRILKGKSKTIWVWVKNNIRKDTR